MTMDLHQVGEVDSRVDLSRCERAVTEQFLDRTQVHSRLEEVGCKGVPQRVRMEMVEVGGSADGMIQETPHRSIT